MEGYDIDRALTVDRLERRRRKLADMRASAAAGGIPVREFDEIAATVDHSIPETPAVVEWIDDAPVGRELA